MKRVLIYGEVLFDIFPDGKKILGGAPFNVAWHLRGFGYDPLFISSVGKDTLGVAAMTAMQEWGLNCDGIYLNESLPTGQVVVDFTSGQPSYQIDPTQAYGYVPLSHINEALDGISPTICYHGSLALWSEEARAVLTNLISDRNLPVLLDINLRAPWWKKAQVHKLLLGTTHLKINSDELALIAAESTSANGNEIEQLAEWCLREFSLSSIYVTQGESGAFYLDGTGQQLDVSASAVSDLEFVDAVGAGDAFCSVCIIGLLEGWPIQTTLVRASAFAGQICRIQGAISADRTLYRNAKLSWDGENAGQ